MKAFIFLIALLPAQLFAQTEFKKRSQLLALEFLQGFNRPQGGPELYLADLRLAYQYTVVPGILRLGATAGGAYSNRTASAFAGPTAALRLLNLNTEMGSVANLQLLLEHLWGTGHQKLAGGGLRAALGNTVLLSLLAHRDYHHDYWNFQFGIGINFIHEKIHPVNPD